MRARLALLLCLLMAYQSAMGALALVPNCPMPAHEMSGHAMSAHEMAGHDMPAHAMAEHTMPVSMQPDTATATAGDHQCCPEQAPSSSSGKLCDHHEACGACGFLALPSFQDLPPPLHSTQAWTEVQSRCLPRDPTTVWRPPLSS